ncbi:MAG: ABC transporter ATP-binding protein [Streptococcaceae bacterium]|nr:ABC transporter ATP-binding protein [Streptococcaceae bacterium]MCL2681820.1 ABC transporter ATP-binding protein [Streptococcaceae bacterium]MCL2858700.1 ABC transporter ATP-binding protein [Streptococcaceae bacterium]
MTTTVSIKDLTVQFEDKKILDDLSIDFQTGEIVGLIGPSGAGKSTFINAMIGMIKVNSGQVTLFDTLMPNRPIMNQVGYMAQSDALFPELTGRDNLEFFGALQGLSKKDLSEKMNKAAELVNLTDQLDRKISQYSGGMKRRLSLAIALQTDAPLILLDEPTVGIDPELRQEIWQELDHQAKQGKTILVTTHVMDEAEKCDQVLLLREGKFVAQGSPSQLKERYAVQSIEEAFIAAGKELSHEN